MTAYAVDASTAVKLYLPEAHAAQAAALFGLLAPDPPAATLHVPDLFYAECGNIFWKHARRGTISATHAAGYEAALRALPLVRTPTFDLAADALSIALAHGTTAYDACYVALAARLGVPLVTADQKLAQRLAGTVHAPVWLGSWAPPGP